MQIHINLIGGRCAYFLFRLIFCYWFAGYNRTRMLGTWAFLPKSACESMQYISWCSRSAAKHWSLRLRLRVCRRRWIDKFIVHQACIEMRVRVRHSINLIWTSFRNRACMFTCPCYTYIYILGTFEDNKHNTAEPIVTETLRGWNDERFQSNIYNILTVYPGYVYACLRVCLRRRRRRFLLRFDFIVCV